MAKDSFTSLAKSFGIMMTKDLAKVERSRKGNISKEKLLDLAFGYPEDLLKPFGRSEVVAAKHGFSRQIVNELAAWVCMLLLESGMPK